MDARIEQIKMKLINKNIELNETISIDEIRGFEFEYNVKLPEELVKFYTQISNGCRMLDQYFLYKFEEWKFNSERISKEFPFEEYWIWEDDEGDARIDYKVIENGVIELIDIGDAQTWNIVANGKQYGKMWFFSDVGIQPAAPAKTFLEWFEFWLDGNDNYFSEFI